MNTFSIMIVGVGGQGTVLASRVLGQVLMNAGFDVKVSEVHGMSQRGGSVVTYVRYGDKVYSPVINEGEADIVLSFEQMEALRALPFLKRGGTMITDVHTVQPMSVMTGKASYPSDILEKLSASCELIAVDALEKAVNAGTAKASNTVLLGVLSKRMPFDRALWIDALRECVPPKYLEANLKAFENGRNS